MGAAGSGRIKLTDPNGNIILADRIVPKAFTCLDYLISDGKSCIFLSEFGCKSLLKEL